MKLLAKWSFTHLYDVSPRVTMFMVRISLGDKSALPYWCWGKLVVIKLCIFLVIHIHKKIIGYLFTPVSMYTAVPVKISCVSLVSANSSNQERTPPLFFPTQNPGQMGVRRFTHSPTCSTMMHDNTFIPQCFCYNIDWLPETCCRRVQSVVLSGINLIVPNV